MLCIRVVKESVRIAVTGWLLFIFTSFQGVSYHHYALNDLSIFVLEVDPQQCLIVPVHAFDQVIGRKSVQEMAEEHQALAAINGGFFKITPFEGQPAGILKIDHKWFGWPAKTRGAIGWSHDGRLVLFDRLLFTGTFTILDKVFDLDGLNRFPQKSEKILFTPIFNTKTLTSSNGFEVIVRQNHVHFVREGGNSYIPPDGYVISFESKNEFAFWKTIPLEIPIDLEIQILPQLSPSLVKEWSLLPHIVGGTPLLVRDGNVITDYSPENALTTFLLRPHTRSAVGLLSNGHWLFVIVEGKHWMLSGGITILNLAKLMAYLGCVEALNLDGGGSSSMVLNGKMVNHPRGDEEEALGETKGRAVSDAILIIPK
jgi:hypothetical protein